MMMMIIMITLAIVKSKEHELVVDVRPDDCHQDCDGGW